MSPSYEHPKFITEEQVSEILTWPLIYNAIEIAMVSVSDHQSSDLPIAVENPRGITITPDGNGVLVSMSGVIENYEIQKLDPLFPTKKKHNTLACKLLTVFPNNVDHNKPVIGATIFLFNTDTGKLTCMLEAKRITAMRTAGASIVATKFLYFDRLSVEEKASKKVLAIVGCGVQGSAHAEGMISTFDFVEIRLWNRTKSKADELQHHLEEYKRETKNPKIQIIFCESVELCCYNADVIVTATSSETPVVKLAMVKEKCHINAIGIGRRHHSELSPEMYKTAGVYFDSMTLARKEFAHRESKILGQTGDVMTMKTSTPTSPITIFQGLGMAVEDGIVGQYVYEKFMLKK